MPVTIRVHASLDAEGRITQRVVKDAALALASGYGIEVSVEVLEVPVAGEEAREHGLPRVIVEAEGASLVVSEGHPPSMSSVVDAVFGVIESSVPLAYGFPLMGEATA